MNMDTAKYHVDLIVKFGGSAITDKSKLETLREDSLSKAAGLISLCHKQNLTCIVVHGAGSFGHHQAKEFKVNSGWQHFKEGKNIEHAKRGFCLTRKSVTMLNQHVVDSLLKQNIPAIGLSVCGCWVTENGKVVKYDIEYVSELLRNGFIPVLHGDCVLDRAKGSNILSGDTIIQTFTEAFNVSRVVFLTSVKGIYSCPPEDNPDAELLQTVRVGNQGNILRQDGGDILRQDGGDILMTNEGTDVTGGMSLKFKTAVSIATKTLGKTCVFICMIGSKYANDVCIHGMNTNSDSGTEIIFID